MTYESALEDIFADKEKPIAKHVSKEMGRFDVMVQDILGDFTARKEPQTDQDEKREQIPYEKRVQIPQSTTQLQIAGKEEGWLDVLGKSVIGGFAQYGKGLAGTAKAGLEATGLYHFISEAQKTWEEDESLLAIPVIGLKEAERFWSPEVGESKAKKYAAATVSSMVQSSISMLIGIRTGSPLVGLTLFGVTAFGNKYLQMRNAGEDVTTSLVGSGIVGISEAVTEIPAYRALVNPLTKNLVRRAFNVLLPQMAGEQINTIVESAVDKVTIRPDMTFRDYLNDAFDTAVVTTLQVGGQTTIMHPVIRHESERIKLESMETLRDKGASISRQQDATRTLSSLMEDREKALRWYEDTLPKLKTKPKQISLPEEFRLAGSHFIKADSVAFENTLKEMLLGLKPETATQKFKIGLAEDAMKQGNIQEASKLISEVSAALPKEARLQNVEETYTQFLVNEMTEGLKMKEEEEVYQKPLWLAEVEPKADILQRVGAVVDELKGYEPGASVETGRTIEGVLRDAIINPISAALGFKQLGMTKEFESSAKSVFEVANKIKKAVPEVSKDVDRLMEQLTPVEAKPKVAPREAMPFQEVKGQPEVGDTVSAVVEEGKQPMTGVITEKRIGINPVTKAEIPVVDIKLADGTVETIAQSDVKVVKPPVAQIPADIIKQAQELLIPIKDKTLPQQPNEPFEDYTSRVTQEAQKLRIPRKGKTIESIRQEVIAKQAEMKDKAAKLEVQREPLSKELLLPKLKKLIDKIFTGKKGHTESERESHFARLSRYSPEMLSTTIRNMEEHYRDEVKEIKEAEVKALLQAKIEEKAEEAQEGEEFQSPDRDLSKLGEDELRGALSKSASQQIESNPGMSKEGWTGYIETSFPNIAKSHIEKMWDDAHGKYEQETGIHEKATLEHHQQITLDQFGKELYESTKGDLNIAVKKIAEVDVPIDPDVAAVSKDYNDYVEQMKQKKAQPEPFRQRIKRVVKTGVDLVSILRESSNEGHSEYARALLNNPIIMKALGVVRVKVNLYAPIKKRSEYDEDKKGVKWISMNLPWILQKDMIEGEIFHEVNHALMVEKIRDSRVRKAFMPIFDQYLATFSPEEVKIIEWMEKNKGKVHPSVDQSSLNGLFYAGQNLDEFVASIGDGAFQNYLSGIKYVPPTGEKPGAVMSLLTKFWNVVKAKVYGNAPGIDASLLEVLTSRIAEVLEMPAPTETQAGRVEMKAPPRVEDMLDAVSEMTGEAKFSGKKLLKDTQPPIWDKHLSTVTEAEYAISRSAHQASFIAANMINKFIRKEGISDAVAKVVVDSDAAGVLTGYENLSPSDKVKHDAIRSTFDFVIRDYMKRLYVDDAVYRLGKQEGRVVTSEEKSRIVKEADDFINKHYTENYYPRFRFGNQALVIRDEKGKTISFSSHDSARELNRVLTNFEQTMKGLQKYDETGNQTTPTFQHFDVRQKFTDFSAIMFAVSNARVLENTLKRNDATSQDIKKLMGLVGTEYLKKWAGGRFAHRQETVIPGYSTDIAKSLHRYIESMPKAMAKHFMAARVADAVAELPFKLQERGQDIVDFYNGKKWKEGRVNVAIRTALFAYYMLLKPVTGMINASQRYITTVPFAMTNAGIEGVKAAQRAQTKEINFYKLQLKQSNFNIFKPKPSFEVLDDFNEISYKDKLILKNLIAEGVISPVRTHEIVEESKIGRIVGFFMSLTEKSNRLHAAFTALDIGHMKGLKGEELETYVRKFIDGTQWIYDKANRAPLTRGKLAPVMLFKSFVLNDMNFVKELCPNKKALGMAVAARLSLGGVGGIYGASAFMTVLGFVMKSILGDDDWELDKKEFKNKFPRVLIHGLPSLVGISGSSMFGSSELFGTAMTPPLIAWWRVGKEFGTTTGVQPETWRKVLPSQAKKLWRLNLKKRFQDEDIKQLPVEIRKRVQFLWKDTPKEQQTWEKVIDIIGFATETPAQFYEAVHAIKATGRIVRARKTRLARKLANALYEKDKEKAAEIKKEMKEKGYAVSPASVIRFRRRRRYAEEE